MAMPLRRVIRNIIINAVFQNTTGAKGLPKPGYQRIFKLQDPINSYGSFDVKVLQENLLKQFPKSKYPNIDFSWVKEETLPGQILKYVTELIEESKK